MITLHDMKCQCLDCQDMREQEADQLGTAYGVLIGILLSLAIYTGLAFWQYGN